MPVWPCVLAGSLLSLCFSGTMTWWGDCGYLCKRHFVGLREPWEFANLFILLPSWYCMPVELRSCLSKPRCPDIASVIHSAFLDAKGSFYAICRPWRLLYTCSHETLWRQPIWLAILRSSLCKASRNAFLLGFGFCFLFVLPCYLSEQIKSNR